MIVIVPYIFRMMRAAMIEALESDYVEMARLKGVPERRIVLRHALPNALAPTIQVIGLNFLYLAGGVVVVEFVFNFPGIGQGLVFAVGNRDIPVIQFIVVVLAAFYVFMNILTDVIALLVTPRRRIASRLWPLPRPRCPPRPANAPSGWSVTRGWRCCGRRCAPPAVRSASRWPHWSCWSPSWVRR